MGIVQELDVTRPTTVVRILAIVTVILAAVCVILAVAWSREAKEADCWRAAFEDDEIPAAGVC